MAQQPQGNQVVPPPIFRTPDEMLLHIQSFLEHPIALANLAATSRHMWLRLGAGDAIHIREARFFERRVQRNQAKADFEMKQAEDYRNRIRNLLANGRWDDAGDLEEEYTEHQYGEMRYVHQVMSRRPPTLLLAIQGGCRIELISRILDIYQREMPGMSYITGLWGRGCWPGHSLTHMAVYVGRTDVLQLLQTRGLLTQDTVFSAVVTREEAPSDSTRLQTETPIQSAMKSWQDNAAEWLIQNCNVGVDAELLNYAVSCGGGSMIHLLMRHYRQQHPDDVPLTLENCLRTALRHEEDRRGVIDALVIQGADLTERGALHEQLLPFAVRHGGALNASHLLGRLAHLHMITRRSFQRVVVAAAMRFPAHEFLPAAITYAYLLAPGDTYDRAAAQHQGLCYLMSVELTGRRPGAEAARRAAGVGMLLDAGLPMTPRFLSLLGDTATDGEAVTLMNYLVGRGCPLDQPRARRRWDAQGDDVVRHPLRWLAWVKQKPRAVACLLAHGARFADPGAHPWVPDAVGALFCAVFNNPAREWRAERDAMVARAQEGRFAVDMAVFDHADPDPVRFCRQIMTLYLCVYTAPVWAHWDPNRPRFLLCGVFEPRPRDQWPARLFDVDYYP